TFIHPKRNEIAREKFIKKLEEIDKEQIVYLDESGIEDNACLDYGWSLKGSRCYDKKVFQHKRRISMLAGLCSKRIMAPLVFEGTCNSVVFEAYVRDILIKEPMSLAALLASDCTKSKISSCVNNGVRSMYLQVSNSTRKLGSTTKTLAFVDLRAKISCCSKPKPMPIFKTWLTGPELSCFSTKLSIACRGSVPS
ncbi:MAG: hypothetical protein EB003_12705, partial [Flavobacteriia bacterium]|nr:hypothetical protein [Flavobacteriia bacterium]